MSASCYCYLENSPYSLFRRKTEVSCDLPPKHSLERLSLGSRTCQSLLTGSPFPMGRSRVESRGTDSADATTGCQAAGLHTPCLIHGTGRRSHYRFTALRCGVRNTSFAAENKAMWGGFTKAPWEKTQYCPQRLEHCV